MTDFLHALYGDCGELWWYVWTLGAGGTAKYTHWFQAQDIPRAAELCAAAGKLDAEATAHAAELRDVFAAMLTARMDAPAAPDPAAAVNVDDFIDAE